jgi:nucleoside-diphosphate-sugar epimerase
MRIFLAGATGVIGRSLIPLLRDAGHEVTGTTRTTEGKDRLEALGIDAVVVDVFGRKTLERSVSVVAWGTKSSADMRMVSPARHPENASQM